VDYLTGSVFARLRHSVFECEVWTETFRATRRVLGSVTFGASAVPGWWCARSWCSRSLGLLAAGPAGHGAVVGVPGPVVAGSGGRPGVGGRRRAAGADPATPIDRRYDGSPAVKTAGRGSVG
jgi:hypothetical protein